MSKTIDEKVVEMKFDNKNFESNVNKTMSTLEKLKQKLNLTGASKGLENVNAAAKNFNMDGMRNSLESIRMKFSALQIIGISALANITNSAINAGKRIVSALTIDPIKTGFNEYETKINAIQTIMSNTASKGVTMNDVTDVLDELNRYADKTIYNFAEMTRNIGTFTAAGVGLKESASAIQGIANLAAASGSSSQQASTAMYQLSQALASGTVKLMDWNSVVNAGMGGQKFQEALKATAREHGVAVDSIIKKQGSFRDSLQDGWITADILNETLSKFTIDGAKKYANSMMESGKYTQEQTDALIKEAQSMEDAATKVKTFTQLWDTLKESAQSGWTESWEIIVGNFEEAKSFLTEISDTIGKVLGDSADARNKVLKDWKDLGGRKATIDALKNTYEGILSIAKPIKEAFKEIFPPITGKQLSNFSEGLKNLTAKLKISDEIADKLKRTFKGLFSIFDIGKKALVAVFKPLLEFATGSTVSSLGSGLLTLTAKIGDFFTKLNESTSIGNAFKFASDTISGGLHIISDGITFILNKFNGIGNILPKVLEYISKFANVITNTLGKAFAWIRENISVGDIFAGLAGGGIFIFLKKLSDVCGSVKSIFDKIGDMFSGVKKSTGPFVEVLNSLKEALSAFAQGIKVASLIGIAVAVSLLSSSIRKLSEVDAIKVGTSLIAIAIMIKELNVGFAGLCKTILAYPAKKVFTASLSLIAIAGAVNILATAMTKISKLSWSGVIKGLIGVGVCITALSESIKVMSYNNITLRTSIALLAMAKACQMLSNVVEKFGSMSLKEISKGLIGLGGALLILTKGINAISNSSSVLSSSKGISTFTKGGVALKTSIALLAMAKACQMLSNVVEKFGSMSLKEIAKGLGSMAVSIGALCLGIRAIDNTKISLKTSIALLTIAKACEMLGNVITRLGSLSWNNIAKGLGGMTVSITALCIGIKAIDNTKISLKTSIALLALAKSCEMLANSIVNISNLSWNEVAKGLVSLSTALLVFTKVIKSLSTFNGGKALAGSLSILIISESLKNVSDSLSVIGSLSWNSVAKGLVGMFGALLELSLILKLLSSINGINGIIASASIVIASKSLSEIANALQKIGSLSWNSVAKGLVGMGGALLELSLIIKSLTVLNGLSGIIGGAVIWVAVQGLDKLANALQKFGSMSWSEIGRGLSAMGGALAEVSVISGALGYLTNIAGIIGAGTIWVAVQGLDKLANALIKFGSMSWDEIKRGLSAMGGALGEIGLGGLLNTLSGLGAISIAAIAEPLGKLADSFKKWGDIRYEDISEGLKALNVAFAEIALGSFVNTLSILGAPAIATIAEPLGKLADSVMKWKDVVIPENLGFNLGELAIAIAKFTLDGLGADALSQAAPAIGTMAESISKWKDVTVPENIDTGLASIAKGIQHFSFAFAGGWSLSTVVDPLSKLPEALSKWKDVTIPKNIDSDLFKIASGMQHFSFAFTSGWSLSTIIDPLSKLPAALAKWKDLTVSDNVKNGLKTIADGIREFSMLDTIKLSSIAGPLSTLSTSFVKISSIQVDGTKLVDFANKIKDCCNKLKDVNTSSIGTISGSIDSLVSLIKKVNGTNVSNISKFVSAVNELNNINIGEIKVDTSSLSSSISSIKKAMTDIGSNIKNSKSSISNAMKIAVSGLPSSINNSKKASLDAIMSIINGMISKISSNKNRVTSAFSSLVSGAYNGIISNRQTFVTAGSYLGDGLVSGINSKKTAAYNAGFALGQKAVQGEKDGQQSHSPSKLTFKAGKWLGEGLINGMSAISSKVNNAGKNMGSNVSDNISYALESVNSILNSDVGQPTIRPVLDLSDVSYGFGTINDMFNRNTLGISSNVGIISSSMNNRIQNGANNDIVSSIDKLRKDLRNIKRNTYNINGISYDDGSNITEAVETLIRAVNVEGRK